MNMSLYEQHLRNEAVGLTCMVNMIT